MISNFNFPALLHLFSLIFGFNCDKARTRGEDGVSVYRGIFHVEATCCHLIKPLVYLQQRFQIVVFRCRSVVVRLQVAQLDVCVDTLTCKILPGPQRRAELKRIDLPGA